jgi:MoaA/NifB/PqqE/SkfB family radical SAM enzyme
MSAEWQPISIDLDATRQYRRNKAASSNKELDIAAILGKATYPQRLMAGLDNISMQELESHLRDSRIVTLGLRLTNVCNYDCIYCGTAENRGSDTPSVLTTAEYKDLIQQAADLGARSIIFGANGEPTLTKDVLEILEFTGSLGLTPIIFSNISVMGNDALCQRRHGVDGEEFAQRLDKAGTTLIISVESLIEERYDHIMGVKAFEYFEKAVERIRKTSLPAERFFEGRPLCRVAVSAVMMPINYDERFKLIEFAHSLNGVAILKPPSLHGSAAANKDQMFTPEEVVRIRPEVEKISDKQATLQILTLACASWTLSFSVNNEGNFMACMTEEVNPFGHGANVRTKRLADLIEMRNEMVKLRNTICPVKDKFYKRTQSAEM